VLALAIVKDEEELLPVFERLSLIY